MDSQKDLQQNSSTTSEGLPSPTPTTIKTEDSAGPSEIKTDEDVNNPWEMAAQEYYSRQNNRKDDSIWVPWTEEQTRLIKQSFEDAITKYGAEVFDGDDDERLDIPVFDSPDEDTVTDDDQDAVVEDPPIVAAQQINDDDVPEQASTTMHAGPDDAPEKAVEDPSLPSSTQN